MEYRESNYPKAFAATTVIVAILFALCYLLTIGMPTKQPEGTGGILVNYGTTDEGMGDDYMSVEEPSKAEKANKSKPDKITTETTEKTNTESSDKKVVTQSTEDAPVVTDNSKKPSNTVATETQKAASKPTVNQNALYKGKPNNATGEGDGTTNTPGNQGKPNGSVLSNNYNGDGSGNGGLAMDQRSFVSKPSVDNPKRSSGTVVVDIRVDKNGVVIYARAGAKGTTITDNTLLLKCEQAVYSSRLNASDSAPDTQIGTVVFKFKVN
ncbi:energy transducer TonB [Mucilaginibacter sp. AW1-3]